MKEEQQMWCIFFKTFKNGRFVSVDESGFLMSYTKTCVILALILYSNCLPTTTQYIQHKYKEYSIIIYDRKNTHDAWIWFTNIKIPLSMDTLVGKW